MKVLQSAFLRISQAQATHGAQQHVHYIRVNSAWHSWSSNYRRRSYGLWLLMRYAFPGVCWKSQGQRPSDFTLLRRDRDTHPGMSHQNFENISHGQRLSTNSSVSLRTFFTYDYWFNNLAHLSEQLGIGTQLLFVYHPNTITQFHDFLSTTFLDHQTSFFDLFR